MQGRRLVHEEFSVVLIGMALESVAKASGETGHMERWNNTLRRTNTRYVRKMPSFSKSDFYLELVTRLFIIRYNNLQKACET